VFAFALLLYKALVSSAKWGWCFPLFSDDEGSQTTQHCDARFKWVDLYSLISCWVCATR